MDLKFSVSISDINIYNPAKFREVSMPTSCISKNCVLRNFVLSFTDGISYLIPIKIRAPLISAPLSFAHLIFAHPKKQTIRAPLIFAHWLKFAPLLFSRKQKSIEFFCSHRLCFYDVFVYVMSKIWFWQPKIPVKLLTPVVSFSTK